MAIAKKNLYGLLILFLVILLIAAAVYLKNARQPAQSSLSQTPHGLAKVDCWFKAKADYPPHSCYRMYVPENYAKPEGRWISFPVLKVAAQRSENTPPPTPVLHLGAGGPGAAMYLDIDYAVESIWHDYGAFSLEQGRDLYVIDPRGAGLSEPLLTCDTFIKHVLTYLQKNLSSRDMLAAADQDYADCIQRFKAQGIDLSAYHSVNVAKDTDQLRQVLGIQQWILYGVSYGATYAQVIANEYPSTVSAMLLDSAAFPQFKQDHDFVKKTLAPYQALYNYCQAAVACEKPLEHFPERFWQLQRKLTEQPLKIQVQHPTKAQWVNVVLNGNLFVESVWYGLYGNEIFKDIPSIITELEQGDTSTINAYVTNYLGFLLEDKYGDVSAMAHLCVTDKPFEDKAKLRQLASSLPAGYIRDEALLVLEWPDQCALMGITQGNPKGAQALNTSIPTLFLQGTRDTVTPESDVLEARKNFANSQVLTYPLSHGIISNDPCADDQAAAFLKNPQANLQTVTCTP